MKFTSKYRRNVQIETMYWNEFTMYKNVMNVWEWKVMKLGCCCFKLMIITNVHMSVIDFYGVLMKALRQGKIFVIHCLWRVWYFVLQYLVYKSVHYKCMKAAFECARYWLHFINCTIVITDSLIVFLYFLVKYFAFLVLVYMCIKYYAEKIMYMLNSSIAYFCW